MSCYLLILQVKGYFSGIFLLHKYKSQKAVVAGNQRTLVERTLQTEAKIPSHKQELQSENSLEVEVLWFRSKVAPEPHVSGKWLDLNIYS